MSQAEKGNALEDAVRAMETAILSSSPRFAEGTFQIEPKKVIRSNGVRHEIDLFVTATLGNGYDAIFIFECKNWAEKVGKNEIIVFSEKVKAVSSQKGFFVAKSYTKDAIAQAQRDDRIQLLTVKEMDPSAVMVPGLFHMIVESNPAATVKIDSERLPGTIPSEHLLDLATSSFSLNGTPSDLNTFVQPLIKRFKDEAISRFPSAKLEEGMHVIEFSGQHKFDPNTALLNGVQATCVDVKGTTEISIVKAIVVSAFDVIGRGRTITTRLAVSGVSLDATFIFSP